MMSCDRLWLCAKREIIFLNTHLSYTRCTQRPLRFSAIHICCFSALLFPTKKTPQIESCLFQIRDVRAEDSGDYECQVAGFEEEEGEEKEQQDFSFR